MFESGPCLMLARKAGAYPSGSLDFEVELLSLT
jgi:hypothetical protein